MEWLSESGLINAGVSVDSSSGDWGTPAEIHLVCASFDVCFGVFDENLRCKVSVKDPIKSSLWKLKIEQTLTVAPSDGITKAMEVKSNFDVCAVHSARETTISSMKEIGSGSGYVNANNNVNICVTLKLTDNFGLLNSTGGEYQGRVDDLADVTLVVEERELRVSKSFLALHSAYFNAMFNSSFNEKNLEKIQLEQVVYKEFVDFLKVMHGIHRKVDDHNYVYLLELADKFQVPSVRRLCEEFMVNLKNTYVISNFSERLAALELSEKYKLSNVQELVIETITNIEDLKELAKRHQFKELSDHSKSYIMECALAVIKCRVRSSSSACFGFDA